MLSVGRVSQLAECCVSVLHSQLAVAKGVSLKPESIAVVVTAQTHSTAFDFFTVYF